MDFKTYIDTCRAQGAAARSKLGLPNAPAAPAAATVYDSRTTVAGANFASVPTWTDADILAQFPLTRDNRYMTTADNPSFLRRVSWMYPDDGCFSRAEQLDVQVAQAGKARPYKLFAFGVSSSLQVFTTNNPNGIVYWWYHVVAVVKNSAGQPIVFDAALSPCRPLFWQEWLRLMQNDLAFFDDVADGNGVSVADSNAYTPDSLVTGEPSHSAESLSDQTGAYLPDEWSRQIELGRDPNVVLGATPPWSGYGCFGTIVAGSPTSNVAPGATATATTTCPFATLATGGGFSLGTTSFAVSKDAMSGNGWQVTAKNTGGSTQPLWSNAVCLVGAPSNASVTTVQGSAVNVLPGSNGSSNATCSTGKLVGGGFTTTLGTNAVMRIYNNGRTTGTSSTWQASAQNTTATSKSVTSFAYCLQNTSFTASQVSGTLDSGGNAGVSCGAPQTVGGGFTFPRTTAYTVFNSSTTNITAWFVQMAPPPANGDPNAKAYAECLAHP